MRPRLFKQQLAALQSSLAANLAILRQAPAPQALHDLRVALRRLRALLQPLAQDKEATALYRLAGRLLDTTAPLRDLEVLADDLAAHRRGAAARRRRDALRDGLPALLCGKPVARLEAIVASAGPLLRGRDLPSRRRLEKRTRKMLDTHRARLRRELDRELPELHRLRLAVKRLRYHLEADTGPAAGRRTALAALAAAQQVLGDWHDRSVWLAHAAAETDLAPCRRRWQREQAAFAGALPPGLARLRRALDRLDAGAVD